MKKDKFYLIQGVYFQEGQMFGQAFGPSIEGFRVTVNSAVFHVMFHGVMDTSRNEGLMNDKIGISDILVKDINDSSFSFIKTYERSGNKIFYRFYKSRNCWIGTWQMIGAKGYANCVLIEIDKEKFYDYKITQSGLDTLIGKSKLFISHHDLEKELHPAIHHEDNKRTSSNNTSEDLPF